MIGKRGKVAAAGAVAFFAPTVGLKILMMVWGMDTASEPASVIMVVLSALLGTVAGILVAAVVYDTVEDD